MLLLALTAASSAVGASCAFDPSRLIHPTNILAVAGEAVLPLDKYPPVNLIDEREDTTWVANDKRLVLGFPEAVLAELQLLPGYAKSAALWEANRRPTKIRYRWYPPPKDNGHRAEPSAWSALEVAPPAKLVRAEAALVRLPLHTAGAAVALELEVLEATPRTRSNDICISTLRLISAAPTPPCPDSGAWFYAKTIDGPAISDDRRLEADFDVFDPSLCCFGHSFTGGANLLFSGQCTQRGDGWRFLGATFVFMGVPGPPEEAAYDKVIPMQEYGCTLAVVAGHIYYRNGAPSDCGDLPTRPAPGAGSR